jgi:hypothetical protein
VDIERACLLVCPAGCSQDEHDVSQFEYYCSSELVVVNIHSGEIQKIGPKRLYRWGRGGGGGHWQALRPLCDGVALAAAVADRRVALATDHALPPAPR